MLWSCDNECERKVVQCRSVSVSVRLNPAEKLNKLQLFLVLPVLQGWARASPGLGNAHTQARVRRRGGGRQQAEDTSFFTCFTSYPS